jgi:hypothetical protein
MNDEKSNTSVIKFKNAFEKEEVEEAKQKLDFLAMSH